jgi:hypothetical protein
MQNRDNLLIGGLYTSDYMKMSGEISAPSIRRLYDLRWRPELTPDSPGVEKYKVGGYVDTSEVFEITRAGGTDQDVAIQDYTGSPVDMFITYKVTETNLSVPLDIISTPRTFTVTVDNPTGASQGMFLELWEGSFYYQGEIASVAGNDITLYLPVGYPFSTSATIYICDANMNTALERDYTFDPGDANTRDYHLTRFIVQMAHEAAGDDSRFGDIEGGLTNGVYFGGRGTVSGIDIFNFVYNFRTNGDFASIAYDVKYSDKAGLPSSPSQFGTLVRKSFNGPDKSGVVLQVIKAENNAVVGHTRDASLADLSRFRIRVMGHQTSEY